MTIEWQPIETAPKDAFILLHEDGATRCGMWEGGKWVPAEIPILIDRAGNELVPREVRELRGEKLKLSGFLYEPTHWMPIPDPPLTCIQTNEIEAALERMKAATTRLRETLDEVDEYKDHN